MNKTEILDKLRIYKERNSLRYGIKEIGIFGSVARGEEKTGSDIDVFIQTETPNPFLLVHVKEELEKDLQVKVDIVRLRDKMNPLLLERIEKEGISV